jgi:Rieske Fe-S protein
MLAASRQEDELSQPPTRRRVLAAGAGVAMAPVVAACGDASEDPQFRQVDPPAPGNEVALASDVPVGGCQVFAAKGTVVTQPTEGDYRAFEAECSHKGCFVASSTQGHIPCRCHGSKFDLVDGSPLGGPAKAPLTKVEIVVEDGRIYTA